MADTFVTHEQHRADLATLKADMLQTSLLSTADIVRLEERLTAVEHRLGGVATSAELLHYATKADLAAFRQEVLTAIERLHTDNARLEARLPRFVVQTAAIGGLAGALTTLVLLKLLHVI